jgi:hypothetical protein
VWRSRNERSTKAKKEALVAADEVVRTHVALSEEELNSILQAIGGYQSYMRSFFHRSMLSPEPEDPKGTARLREARDALVKSRKEREQQSEDKEREQALATVMGISQEATYLQGILQDIRAQGWDLCRKKR